MTGSTTDSDHATGGASAPERRRVRGALALLAALYAVHALVSWSWMYANGFLARPPAPEAAGVRLRAADMLLALRDGGPWRWIAEAYRDGDHHTPLLPMVGRLVGQVLGDGVSPVAMWLTLQVFVALLCAGTYRLARNFGSPRFALAVAAVTLCCPIVTGFQRDFFATLPMVALLVWSLDALVRSRLFARPGPSFAFGLLAGLATSPPQWSAGAGQPRPLGGPLRPRGRAVARRQPGDGARLHGRGRA